MKSRTFVAVLLALFLTNVAIVFAGDKEIKVDNNIAECWTSTYVLCAEETVDCTDCQNNRMLYWDVDGNCTALWYKDAECCDSFSGCTTVVECPHDEN